MKCLYPPLENKKHVLLALFLKTLLVATPLTFKGISEHTFTNSGLTRKIIAKKKIIDYKKLQKIRLLGRKKNVSESIYYLDGTFHKKGIQIDFKRGYFYEGKFFMQGCEMQNKDSFVKAQNAVVQEEFVEFKKLFLVQKGN